MKRLELRELPGGIAVALGPRYPTEDATSKVVPGAIYAVDQSVKKKADARRNWQDAIAGGADVKDLLLVLDDTYDFEPETP